MTSTELAVWSAIAAAGLIGSAVCSGFETGAYTVDRLRLETDASRGDRAAKRLTRELEKPSSLLATILVSNNIANYAGSLGVAAILAGAGLTDAAVVILNAIVLTPMLLIFGEILPKEMFRSGSDRMTTALAPFAAAARTLYTITGIVPALTLFGRLISRLLGTGAKVELTGRREQLAALLLEGVRAGVLSERQSGLIDHAMEFRDATVADLMRPWHASTRINENWTGTKAQSVAAKNPRNRYIVTDTKGKPTGSISAAAIWTLGNDRISSVSEPIIRIDPKRPATEALSTLLDAGTRVAVVTRHNSPIGIISVRLLIEPLTGELGALEV